MEGILKEGRLKGKGSQVPDGYCAGETPAWFFSDKYTDILINRSLWGASEVVLPEVLLCLGDSR